MKKILEFLKELFKIVFYPVYSEESHSEYRYDIQEEFERKHNN